MVLRRIRFERTARSESNLPSVEKVEILSSLGDIRVLEVLASRFGTENVLKS